MFHRISFFFVSCIINVCNVQLQIKRKKGMCLSINEMSLSARELFFVNTPKERIVGLGVSQMHNAMVWANYICTKVTELYNNIPT